MSITTNPAGSGQASPEVAGKVSAFTPTPGSRFWESPALKRRSKHYPERFSDRVPQRIRMLMNVRPDLWCSGTPGTILRRNEVYVAWTNSHGAVAGICENGEVLGVKPDEFEVVDWYIENNELRNGHNEQGKTL